MVIIRFILLCCMLFFPHRVHARSLSVFQELKVLAITNNAKDLRAYLQMFPAVQDSQSKEPPHITPLCVAAGAGNFEVAKVLIEHGARVDTTINVDGFKVQALDFAVAAGHADIVELLLDNGGVHSPSAVRQLIVRVLVTLKGPSFAATKFDFLRPDLDARSARSFSERLRDRLDKSIK